MMHQKSVMPWTGDTIWKEVSPTGLSLTSWVDAYVNVILKSMLDQEETTAPRTCPGTPTPDDSCVTRFVGWIVAQAEAAILAQEEEFVSDLVARSLEKICKEIQEDPDRGEDRLDVSDTRAASQVNEKRNIGIFYRKDFSTETTCYQNSQQTADKMSTGDHFDTFSSEFVSGVIDKIAKEQVRDGYSVKSLSDGNMLNVFALDRAQQGKGMAQETTAEYKQDALDVFATEFVLNILNKVDQNEQVDRNTYIYKVATKGNTGNFGHSNPIQTTEKPLTPTCKSSAVSEAFQRIKHPSKDRPVDADFSYVYRRLTHSFEEGVDDSVISLVMEAIPQHTTWSKNFEAVDKSIRSVENRKKQDLTLHRCKAMAPQQLDRPATKPPGKCFLDIFQMKKSGRETTRSGGNIQPSVGVVTPETSKHTAPSRTRRFLTSMRNSFLRLGIATTLTRRGQKRIFV